MIKKPNKHKDNMKLFLESSTRISRTCWRDMSSRNWRLNSLCKLQMVEQKKCFNDLRLSNPGLENKKYDIFNKIFRVIIRVPSGCANMSILYDKCFVVLTAKSTDIFVPVGQFAVLWNWSRYHSELLLIVFSNVKFLIIVRWNMGLYRTAWSCFHILTSQVSDIFFMYLSQYYRFSFIFMGQWKFQVFVFNSFCSIHIKTLLQVSLCQKCPESGFIDHFSISS